MSPKISQLLIPRNSTIVRALQQMDKIGFKLLIVTEEQSHKFIGLLTIGDIQRAIIDNCSLDKKISEIIRKDFLIAKIGDPIEKTKHIMLKYRLVYMPIINQEDDILDIIFWEDIIKEEENQIFPTLNLPVVIMAGGYGTRLKPLTNVLPKPLFPFGESTILENIIDRFKKYSCCNFEISVNYKAKLIKFYFDSIAKKDYRINFFLENEPLGTAGSLYLLKNKLKSTFFVSNCDILIDEDYSAIHKYHVENKNELTIVASLKSYHIPYGTIESAEDGQLTSLTEKPQLDFMINCGMYILEPHLLDEIPVNTFFHLTDLIEKIRNRSGRVGVFPISEKSWVDIGEWASYSKILFDHSVE
jgi:dTDP-glucose pyrophosphorylase